MNFLDVEIESGATLFAFCGAVEDSSDEIKCKEEELMQYRRPVGFGPSLNK